MNICFVIPVFNDSSSLQELLERIFTVSKHNGYNANIIVVDDGSEQETWDSIRKIRELHRDKKIALIRLRRNYGQALATLAGLILSSSEYVVTLDSDLQHAPEYTPKLISTLKDKKCDLVYAEGYDGHSGTRKKAKSLYKALGTMVIGRSALINASSFRAISKELINKHVRPDSKKIFFLDEYLVINSNSTEFCSLKHHPRPQGKSSYSVLKLTKLAALLILHSTYFSRRLQALGATFFTLGLAAILYITLAERSTLALNLLYSSASIVTLSIAHKLWLLKKTKNFDIETLEVIPSE